MIESFTRPLSRKTKSSCYSREIDPQINRIYEKLAEKFRKPSSTSDEIGLAVAIIELVTPFASQVAAQKSYDLFHAVMQVPISPAFRPRHKWQVSRLTMHTAYKWDGLLPPVEDPDDIIAFLNYHFHFGVPDRDEPIQYALSALAHASSPIAIEALKRFRPGELFVRGICYAFGNDRPLQLRKAALFVLPLIPNLFDTQYLIVRQYQMIELCADWASTVDSIEHTHDTKKAILAGLFRMISSPPWRRHIVAGSWELLEYFTSVPDDFPFLRVCVDDPDLIDVVGKVENPRAIESWLGILWLKYKELTPQVRERLEEVTKERARSGKMDTHWYLSRMRSELQAVE